MTAFSLSPRYLQILNQGGLVPRTSHSLDSLVSIQCVGSPLKPDLYDYIRDGIKPVFVNNVSGRDCILPHPNSPDNVFTGGTDLCAGLVGAVPSLPIYSGVIQAAMLGASVEAWDDDGKRVHLGEGDMVVTKPYPMMPLGFLGDDENQTRFKDAYFNHYLHTTIWYHADHSRSLCRVLRALLRYTTVLLDEHGGVNILGRSDGVLNPQGVRFGSAELYAIVELMKDE